MDYFSNSNNDTCKIASNFAKTLKPGDIVLLRGDLGSGKTTFTQCLAKTLGIKRNLTSPTFVVMKEYVVPNNKNITKLIHIDCYRLSNPNDAESIGLEEVLQDKKAVIVIEWPEKVEELLKNITAKNIVFDYLSENKRKINYE